MCFAREKKNVRFPAVALFSGHLVTPMSVSKIAGNSDMHAVIPFDEIVPGATVRLAVIQGTQYLSVRDLIMYLCDKDVNQANEVWRRMGLDKKEELSEHLAAFKFSGRGAGEQPVITFPGSIKLVMMLPGKRVQLYRTTLAGILSRYFTGDTELIQEIEKNRIVGQKRSYSKFAQDIERDVQEGQDDIPQTQYIYATKSPAFPGLIKIGRTINMRARLSSLNTSCAPAPHTLVTMAPTLDMFRDEYLAHEHFSQERRQGEFFEVDENDVKEYFTHVILAQYHEDLVESMRM